MTTEIEAPAAEIAVTIAEPIAEVLADVVADQAASAELAQEIAEAALEGERGRRLSELEMGLDACLESTTNLAQSLETLPAMLAETTLSHLTPMEARLSAVEGALAEMTAAALSQWTPPSLVEVPPEVTITEASEAAPAPADAEESPAPAPRARRFHSI